ncbi:hypothetical protein [Xanthobacter aminoxidans]|uniref:hypothetical protein n=1 Tax=Xanthobacter aminoxidans TaxID=186280 RepID=UPI003728B4F6
MVGDAGAARKGRSHVSHDAGEGHRDLGRERVRAQDDVAAAVPLPPSVPRTVLASELRPYRDHVDADELHAAAVRAGLVGVGVDEVLVASGALDDETATHLLARDLGLPVGAPNLANLPDDPAMAEAVLRTGTLMLGTGSGRPRFVMAARGRIVRRLRRGLKRDAGLASRVELISPAALARRVDAVCAPSFAAAATARLVLSDPLKSASTLRPGRIVGLAAAAIGLPLALLLALAPEMGLLAVQAALSLVFLAWIALRLAGCLYVPPDEPVPALDARSLPVYSLLVPLYHETASLPLLVAALSALDYPVLCSKLT